MGTSLTMVLVVLGVACATWQYAGIGGALSVLVLAFLWSLNSESPGAKPDEAGDGTLQGQRLYRFGFSLVQVCIQLRPHLLLAICVSLRTWLCH